MKREEEISIEKFDKVKSISLNKAEDLWRSIDANVFG